MASSNSDLMYEAFSNQVSAFNTLSAKMNAIDARMTDFGINMGTLNLNLAIPPYSGDSKYFQSWVKAIEKQAMLDHLNDEGVKRLTFQTSKGAVSDFHQRFLQENPNESWATLKRELMIRFAEVTDPMHAFTLLRNVKQKTSENVTVYAERILSLGRESFPVGTDRQTIEKQLIGFFIDGLAQDSLKMKLLRDNPTAFQAAVNTALQEQNLRKRFQLGTNHSWRQNTTSHHETMEVDHIRPRREARYSNRNSYVNGMHNSKPPKFKDDIICFNCSKPKHIKRFCPLNRRSSYQEN